MATRAGVYTNEFVSAAGILALPGPVALFFSLKRTAVGVTTSAPGCRVGTNTGIVARGIRTSECLIAANALSPFPESTAVTSTTGPHQIVTKGISATGGTDTCKTVAERLATL